jgi:hypothetical protein
MPALDDQLEKERQLTAALDKAALGLREEFEDRIQKLREEMGDLIRSSVAAPTTEAPAAGFSNSGALLSAAEAIDRTRSQTQVLAALLEGADSLATRAVVLLTRPENIQGWGTIGFEESGKPIEEIRLAYRSGTPWGEMAGARGMVSLSSEHASLLCQPLGAARPDEAVLIPIALADRTAALLYADRFEGDETFDVAGLQLLASFAGLTLETLPLRRRESTPSLRHAEEAGDQPGLAPWDPQGMTARHRPKDEAEAPAAKAAPKAPGEERVDRAEVERAEAAADASKSAAAKPAPAKKKGRKAARRGGAAGEVAAPDNLAGPGTAFAEAEETEERKQEDARRLARLLVSEIKLYNESKVAEALKQRNILSALADEIEQSRKMYDERVDPEIRKSGDYFQDEMVRILAGGDREALGN